MGTGGTTAFLSPEIRAGLALEPHWRFRCVRSDASADADLWRRRAIEVNLPLPEFLKEHARSLTSTYRKYFRDSLQRLKASTDHATSRLRFLLRSFFSHYCPETFRDSLLEK